MTIILSLFAWPRLPLARTYAMAHISKYLLLVSFIGIILPTNSPAFRRWRGHSKLSHTRALKNKTSGPVTPDIFRDSQHDHKSYRPKISNSKLPALPLLILFVDTIAATLVIFPNFCREKATSWCRK